KLPYPSGRPRDARFSVANASSSARHLPPRPRLRFFLILGGAAVLVARKKSACVNRKLHKCVIANRANQFAIMQFSICIPKLLNGFARGGRSQVGADGGFAVALLCVFVVDEQDFDLTQQILRPHRLNQQRLCALPLPLAAKSRKCRKNGGGGIVSLFA